MLVSRQVEVLRQEQPPRRGVDAGKVSRLVRSDAPEGAAGKPCGSSHIPRSHKCSKGSGTLTPNQIKTAAKVALAAGAVAGGIALAKRKPSGPPLWVTDKAAWQRQQSKPKLSPEKAQSIADEAIAGGQKWDVQEKINARRIAEIAAECGTAGKIQAPIKFDAYNRRPRCEIGAGAFGSYYVHTSRKYGVKHIRDADIDIDFEYDVLSKAHATGANVPEPLGINTILDADGDPRSHTLVMSHMDGYQELAGTYRNSSPGSIDGAPEIIKLKALRQFRKLHVGGVAHGDIHGGNVLVNDRSKKVAIIDFGYATSIDDYSHPIHNRTGIENLIGDLRRLPDFVGLGDTDFLLRHKGVIENIRTQADDYSSNWERYELAVWRYHDALERELLWDVRMPRSRFVRSVEQPRIPGLTRRLLTAHANTKDRQQMEEIIAEGLNGPNMLRMGAKNLGVKPARLFLALKPEREARIARRRRQPFGTPLAQDG